VLNKIGLFVFLACSLTFASVIPTYAHHSASSEFDTQTAIQVKGVLTRMDWINPHAYMHLAVKDSTGKVENWDVEMAGLSKLRLAGMGKKQFVVGETYTVTGNPARGGRHMVLIGTLTFPDGQVFRRGAAFEDGGNK
jgi:hypothetical protein